MLLDVQQFEYYEGSSASTHGDPTQAHCPICNVESGYRMYEVWRAKNGILCQAHFCPLHSSKDIEEAPMPKGKIYKDYLEAVSIHGGDARCPICGRHTGSYLPTVWYEKGVPTSLYAFFCGNHSKEDYDKCQQ